MLSSLAQSLQDEPRMEDSYESQGGGNTVESARQVTKNQQCWLLRNAEGKSSLELLLRKPASYLAFLNPQFYCVRWGHYDFICRVLKMKFLT